MSFLFESELPYSTINVMLMAIRRSQIGYYGSAFAAEETRRNNLSFKAVHQFVESVLDAYHSYIGYSCEGIQECPYFYMKGHSFEAMFTHEKGGVAASAWSDK